MDSLWRLASGSTIEHFARDIYLKSNLTTELNRTIKVLQQQYVNDKRILTESPSVTSLCNSLEAILLHGLKEKLKARVSSVFGSSPISERIHQIDYWPVVLILCHNDVSKSLHKLKCITSDVGRCRAWLRLALNDGLIVSYLESLTNDTSLLHGFYRSSAYLRDKEHTDLLKQLLDGLDSLVFQLSCDCLTFNTWSWETLKLVGLGLEQDEPSPVIAADEAIELVDDKKKIEQFGSGKYRKHSTSDKELSEPMNEKDIPVVKVEKEVIDDDQDMVRNIDIMTRNMSDVSELSEKDSEKLDSDKAEAESESESESEHEEVDKVEDDAEDVNATGNGLSINRRMGWSSMPVTRNAEQEESYDSILQSYSTQAILSSTPDMRDFAISFSSQIDNPTSTPISNAFINVSKAPCLDQVKESSPTESLSDLDFEVIPKSIVLNNSDHHTHIFLQNINKLANESGLDEQQYKCQSCQRPIGLIYGKSRLCHFDGHHYCLECHTNDEMIIPARIIYNWNFKKYPVAKRNKNFLQLTESEPLFDIKLLSPILYSIIPEIKQILELRNQLFFLHTYLFTCQESIALELRKMVWPREHLFEHIHLFSVTDLLQVQNGMLAQLLSKAITFSRSHVFSCPLCTLKGFYCEICNSSQILYPFDTNSTKRCEKCKTVFHKKCYLENYEKQSCPKCLRIERREAQDLN